MWFRRFRHRSCPACHPLGGRLGCRGWTFLDGVGGDVDEDEGGVYR